MKGLCGLDQQLARLISSSLALLGCTRASTKLVGRGLHWGPGFSGRQQEKQEEELSGMGMRIEGIGNRCLQQGSLGLDGWSPVDGEMWSI